MEDLKKLAPSSCVFPLFGITFILTTYRGSTKTKLNPEEKRKYEDRRKRCQALRLRQLQRQLEDKSDTIPSCLRRSACPNNFV